MDLLPVAGGPLAGWLDCGLVSLDAESAILAINAPLAAWLEHSCDLLSSRPFWPLLLKQCPAWGAALAQLKTAEEAFSTITLHRPASAQSPVQWLRLDLVRHASGATVRIQSVLPPRDSLEASTWDAQLGNETARREVLVRLARAESQLKSLTDHWPGVIFSQRADFSFRFASAGLTALTGVGPGNGAGQPPSFWDFVHEDDLEELRQQIQRARQLRQPVTTTYRVRHLQTGRVSYVLEHRHLLISPGGLPLGYEGVWLDVTRQTLAEKRLAGAAWKEALSQLTTTLAHDFSNVMAGIHALSESFLDQVGTDHDFVAGILDGKAQARRARRRATAVRHGGQLSVDRGSNRQVAVRRHRIHGVEDEAEDNLPKLDGVEEDREGFLRQLDGAAHAPGKDLAREIGDIGGQLVQVVEVDGAGLALMEGDNSMHQLARLLRAITNLLETLHELMIRSDLIEE